VVKERTFGANTGVGHRIGDMDNELGVDCVVCIKRQLFGETNGNINYLSAVMLVVVWSL
jgi:hypothetical protein